MESDKPDKPLLDMFVVFGAFILTALTIALVLAWSPWITESYAQEQFNKTTNLDYNAGDRVVRVYKNWIDIDGGNYILGGYQFKYVRVYSNGEFLRTATVDSIGKTIHFMTGDVKI